MGGREVVEGFSAPKQEIPLALQREPELPWKAVAGTFGVSRVDAPRPLGMIAAFVPEPVLREVCAVAGRERYLWHELGDSHLLLHR